MSTATATKTEQHAVPGPGLGEGALDGHESRECDDNVAYREQARHDEHLAQRHWETEGKARGDTLQSEQARHDEHRAQRLFTRKGRANGGMDHTPLMGRLARTLPNGVIRSFSLAKAPCWTNDVTARSTASSSGSSMKSNVRGSMSCSPARSFIYNYRAKYKGQAKWRRGNKPVASSR
jgi:phage gpG-like protein